MSRGVLQCYSPPKVLEIVENVKMWKYVKKNVMWYHRQGSYSWLSFSNHHFKKIVCRPLPLCGTQPYNQSINISFYFREWPVTCWPHDASQRKNGQNVNARCRYRVGDDQNGRCHRPRQAQQSLRPRLGSAIVSIRIWRHCWQWRRAFASWPQSRRRRWWSFAPWWRQPSSAEWPS